MPNRGDRYVVQVKPSHIKWGEYRNPTNRAVIQRESYVKIPAGPARDFGLVRGTHYTAHFTDGRAPLPIKAAGNGPERDGVRYAKQFEGVGRGACKAFTPGISPAASRWGTGWRWSFSPPQTSSSP